MPGRHLTPAGSCQEGSDKVDIFSHFVDILTVGNLDVDIRTYVHSAKKISAQDLYLLPVNFLLTVTSDSDAVDVVVGVRVVRVVA
jgi:hypothetical protein